MKAHRRLWRFGQSIKRICAPALMLVSASACFASDPSDRETNFVNPPDACRPGVYWYIMDGHLSRTGITHDLESMKAAGIGNVLFLEVNVGVPRGKVDFLSDPWQVLFAFAVHECERLGMELTLGSGPGWAGSGGPWVKPEDSMQDLVGSRLDVTGPGPVGKALAVPPPHAPFFGPVPASVHAKWAGFYRDVCVLAFPTPDATSAIQNLDEKALYVRAPYSSRPGVRSHFDAQADYPADPADSTIKPDSIVDLTDKLKPDGTLDWQVPPGHWTIMRFVARNNGAITRPAPQPGIGFECNKWDTDAFNAHLDAYVGKLLAKVGPRTPGTGWDRLHIDSWEMGAQNWTPKFREEFKKRRGYDPEPFYPAYTGMLVGSREQTERFLWDLRQTGSELIVDNHAGYLRDYAHQHGFDLSIEPYDMHPGNDFDLGSCADMPMGEFWAVGFNTAFSCLEATSVGHVMGRQVIGGESFTSAPPENWKMYPANLKNQGDWALATGINRFTIHTFAHKPDETRPGMQMGPYGIHWDRGQTFWPMVEPFHRYLSRCSYMLRQGRPIADILYLMPEGAPNVFQAPTSALDGTARMPDRRGYNFDACSTTAFVNLADVHAGNVVFPSGASYHLVVLPQSQTMTPALIHKLDTIIAAGATVVGDPPTKSPSLENYPACDKDVATVAATIWGSAPQQTTPHGKGRIILSQRSDDDHPIFKSQWIWFPQGSPAREYPLGSIMLQRSLTIDKPLSAAAIDVTADNQYTLTINGTAVGTGNDFHKIDHFDITSLLRPGENQIAVKADNTGAAPNPAGFLAAINITFADGSRAAIPTDQQWTASTLGQNNWQPAMVLGSYAMSPWNLPTPTQDIYPDYRQATDILASMNVPPDFQSTGPIRYTHRSAPDREIYFVANRTADSVDTTCTFRVTGRLPQAWDAVTGEIHGLPEFTSDANLTTVPLHFEPYESRFVIFPTQAAPTTAPTTVRHNAEQRAELATLSGPWDVSFDPMLGGPATVQFAQLDDWSKRDEPGIKYYSGIATYRHELDLPDNFALTGSNPRLYLDLGVVNAMARVRVNGQDCGIAWTAPWRVDIAAAAKPGKNDVEIDVANLWINRLIGDAIDPTHAIARTTYHPYHAKDALLPSGLLGPVRIVETSN